MSKFMRSLKLKASALTFVRKRRTQSRQARAF